MARLKRTSVGDRTLFAAGGIVGTLVAVGGKLAWDGIVDRVAGSSVLVTVALIVAVIVLIVMTTGTSRKVDHLIEKANFSITYWPADDPDELYRRVRDVIGQSEQDVEIYAVNSFVEVFKESNEGADEKLQRKYLGEFEKRFPTVKYHRLIQVRNGQRNGAALADLLAPAYRDHYLKMARFAETHPGKGVKVEVVPAKLPTSFVVAKDKNSNGGRIIWQMNRHDPTAESAEVEQIMGVFIITDPDGMLVPRFKQWFDELDRKSEELTVEGIEGPGGDAGAAA